MLISGHGIRDGVEIGSTLPPESLVRCGDDIRYGETCRQDSGFLVSHRAETIGVVVKEITRLHPRQTDSGRRSQTNRLLYIPFDIHLRCYVVKHQSYIRHFLSKTIEGAVIISVHLVVIRRSIDVLEVRLDIRGSGVKAQIQHVLQIGDSIQILIERERHRRGDSIDAPLKGIIDQHLIFAVVLENTIPRRT